MTENKSFVGSALVYAPVGVIRANAVNEPRRGYVSAALKALLPVAEYERGFAKFLHHGSSNREESFPRYEAACKEVERITHALKVIGG